MGGSGARWYQHGGAGCGNTERHVRRGGDTVMAKGLAARARAAMVGRGRRQAGAALAAATLVTTVLVIAPAGATSGAGTLQMASPVWTSSESGPPLVVGVDRIDGTDG